MPCTLVSQTALGKANIELSDRSSGCVTLTTPSGPLTRPMFSVPAAELTARMHPTCKVRHCSILDISPLYQRSPTCYFHAGRYSRLKAGAAVTWPTLQIWCQNWLSCKGLYYSRRVCDGNNLRSWPAPDMFCRQSACKRRRCFLRVRKSLCMCDVGGPNTEKRLLRSCSNLWQA